MHEVTFSFSWVSGICVGNFFYLGRFPDDTFFTRRNDILAETIWKFVVDIRDWITHGWSSPPIASNIDHGGVGLHLWTNRGRVDQCSRLISCGVNGILALQTIGWEDRALASWSEGLREGQKIIGRSRRMGGSIVAMVARFSRSNRMHGGTNTDACRIFSCCSSLCFVTLRICVCFCRLYRHRISCTFNCVERRCPSFDLVAYKARFPFEIEGQRMINSYRLKSACNAKATRVVKRVATVELFFI